MILWYKSSYFYFLVYQWFSRFCNFSSMFSCQLLLEIGLLIAFLYIIGLWILITVFIIRIIDYKEMILLVEVLNLGKSGLKRFKVLSKYKDRSSFFLVFYKVLICLQLFVLFKIYQKAIW